MTYGGRVNHGRRHPSNSSSGGTGSRNLLIFTAIGAWGGYSGAPVEGSGALLGLSTVAGGMLLGAATLFKEDGVRLAGTREPYATDRENTGGLLAGLAFPLTFLSVGMILTFLLEAGAGLETHWVPIWSALLGLAATGYYQGRVLRIGEEQRPTAPWAFVYFAYLLFSLTLVGPLVYGWIEGQVPISESSSAVGILAGPAVAVLIWLMWFTLSQTRRAT